MADKKTFWSECRIIRKEPPGGWSYIKHEKTESSFTLAHELSSIVVVNGKDYCKQNPEETTPEDKKLFFIRVITPDSDASHRVPVDSIHESLKLTCETINKQYNYKILPKEAKAPPKKASKSKPIKYIPPKPMAYLVGSYVKIVKGPYPAVMKKTVQRIDGRRSNEALITRWYSRKLKRVSAWVPLEHLEIVENFKPAKDTCLMHGANTPGSAIDAYKRQHCKICLIQKCKFTFLFKKSAFFLGTRNK